MAGRQDTGKVRIIGGDWRSRQIALPEVPGLRPTPDRVRETVFNWLGPRVVGARVLDAFAGSGALGFEALSRGAAAAVLVERHPAALTALGAAAAALAAPAEILAADAYALLSAPPVDGAFDIIFLDPPFADERLQQLCTLVAQRDWLRADGMLYLERPKSMRQAPAGWRVHKEKQAGQVVYGLYTPAH